MGCNSSRELSLVGMIKGMMSINIHGSSHIKIKSNIWKRGCCSATILLLNWKVSVKMPACQRLSKINSWKSLWWIARKRFPISSSCWQQAEHESSNFFRPLSHTFSEWNGWICQQLGILARDQQRLFVTPNQALLSHQWWFFFPFPTDLRRITAEISNPDNDNLIPG